MIAFNEIFDLLPGAYLVMLAQPPHFPIAAVNKRYQQVSGTDDSIIGRPLFEVFPDNPTNLTASGVRKLRSSLQLVMETGEAHSMDIIRYDVKDEKKAAFVPRHWKPINIPVKAPDGKVVYIINSVEEVTDMIALHDSLDRKDEEAQLQIRDAVLTTQELERMEISRELHDNINQILNSARLYLELAKQQEDPEKFLSLGHRLVGEAIDEVKKLSNALTEPSEEEIDLTEKIEDLLHQMKETGRYSIHNTMDLPDETIIEGKLKLTIIRIIQELFSNVSRHADASTIYFDISFRNRQLHITVKDDGKGFNLDKAKQGQGFINIRSRIAGFDGQMEIASKPGDGCLVKVKMRIDN